jgi:hypothetical protein
MGELQGHVLVQINYTLDEKGLPCFRFQPLPFLKYQYTLLFDDYGYFTGIRYTTKDNVQKEYSTDILELFTVYGFDSDYQNASFPIPSVGYVLEHCDTIDKARENLRHTNRYFAKKTPVISTEDQLTADSLLDTIDGKDWNLTKFLVAPKISLMQVGADNEGADVLIKEMLSSMQAISGTCGVPIDKLGYPEQFSSQSVRLENSESINVQASQKRIEFKRGILSLLSKCVDIHNKLTGQTLDREGFEVVINESAMSLQERKAIMLNDAFDRGLITKKYYLQNHPIIGNDADEILAELEEEEEEKKAEMDSRISKALGGQDEEKEAEEIE